MPPPGSRETLRFGVLCKVTGMNLRAKTRRAAIAVALSMLALDTTIGGPPTTCDSIIWDNYPAGHLPVVDSSEAGPGDVDISQVADDFMFTVGAFEIGGVEWSGGVQPVTEFNIYIYADDGTGTAPTLPERSSAVFTEALIPVADVASSPNAQFRGFFDFSYCLTTSFIAEEGVKYWIAVQGVTDGTADWGLLQSSDMQLSAARYGHPDDGVPYWTGIVGEGIEADTSFRLLGGPFEPGETGACCALSTGCLGDADESGSVDGRDIATFVACALGGQNCANADMDGSGTVDAGDVTAFVGALLSGDCGVARMRCFSDTTESDCAGLGGTWHSGSTCAPNPC